MVVNQQGLTVIFYPRKSLTERPEWYQQSCLYWWLDGFYLFVLLLIFSQLTLGGCSLVAVEDNARSRQMATIADLQPVLVVSVEDVEQSLTVAEVIAHYEGLLAVVDDPETKAKILYRLADLQMLEAEETPFAELTPASDDLVYYDGSTEPDRRLPQLLTTVAMYQQLLSRFPERKENDQVLYQLAKSWDLLGNQEKSLAALKKLVVDYPDSIYFAEAQFRRGDILYSQGDYQSAKDAFAEVARTAGTGSVFYEKAIYMEGWSQFKLGQFDESLASFMLLLDSVIAQHTSEVNFTGESSSLVEDQFRVMGYALSYLQGATTLKELFRKAGSRNYEYLVYEHYAEYLLEQDLYVDALQVYQQYITIHPQSRWSPQFRQKSIEVLAAEGLIAQVIDNKAKFVADYGIENGYRDSQDSATQDYVNNRLVVFIDELARYHHSAAQQLSKQNQPASTQFKLAAKYYLEFTETFPEHPLAQQMTYLRGDSLLEANQWLAAIEAYEKAAYGFGTAYGVNTANRLKTARGLHTESNQSKESELGANAETANKTEETAAQTNPGQQRCQLGADAGFAAISAYETMWATAGTEVQQEIVNQQLASQLRFVEHYASDPRAIQIQAKTVNTLFGLKDYGAAIVQATVITEWATGKHADWQTGQQASGPIVPLDIQLNAHLILGHSHFELAQYPQAEKNYTTALALLPVGDSRHQNIGNLQAASIYRQAEQLVSRQQLKAAIEEFLRVAEVAPQAAISVNARYDAATYMLQLGQYSRAIAVLNEIRTDHPRHEIVNEIPARLAFAYQQTEQWKLAADEFMVLAEQHSDPDVRRQSLWQAAELYNKNASAEKAIIAYRRYANSYAEPADLAMEARFILTELYRKVNDPGKRQFWLKKMLVSHQSQPAKSTERMLNLVTAAAAELADEAYANFRQIKLILPLKHSLQRKKQAMEQAVAYCKVTISLNMAEYTTRATYRLGEIYRNFSTALQNSERPQNLSTLELEQYELLLEEQAYPFEEDAIRIHENNAQRSWQGVYDEWVQASFMVLAKLFPVRYAKTPHLPVISEQIR
jgi:cellulose synthase operon protein C